MKISHSPLAAAALLLSSGIALGQVHAVDIILSVQNGRILTGRVDQSTGLPVTPKYVFQGTMGDVGVPGATFNPGCDSADGTFNPSTQVGLTVRRALRIWNGSNGFALVQGSPNPVTTMNLTKNTTTISTPLIDPASCGVGPDLLLGLANSVGRLHQHPAYQLVGQSDPGVYMLELQVWMTDDATGVSDPICVLFNQNAAQADVDAAFTWAEANFHRACYANCDNSTTAPVLNVADFSCFLNKFAAGDCYANCDGSTTPPVFNVADFSCFLNEFAAGCS